MGEGGSSHPSVTQYSRCMYIEKRHLKILAGIVSALHKQTSFVIYTSANAATYTCTWVQREGHMGNWMLHYDVMREMKSNFQDVETTVVLYHLVTILSSA